MTSNGENRSESMAALFALADLVSPMALRVAASLRIFDRVADGMDTIDALVTATGADPRGIAALTGHLVDRELLTSEDGDRFGLTPLGAALRDSAGPARAALDLDGPVGRYDLAVFGLLDTVRSGEPAFEKLHGTTYWQSISAAPASAAALGELQSPVPLFDAELLLGKVDWSQARRIIDLGGSNGALLVAILERHPHLTGAILDLPGLAENAKRAVRESSVRERATVIPGDFFAGVPSGFDHYLLSAVLADFDDERAVTLLRNVAAAEPAARIVVSEVSMWVPGAPRDFRLDLLMMCGAAGFERDVDEVIALALRAGLTPAATPVQFGQRFVVEFVAGSAESAGSVVPAAR
ncbi:methyltransferase [Nonomuraea sp. LP-02]|uniref:methyltransferase n=1 Tax=Nonomuraea sp. LP-02 TaxID=3097960 RepID=UPI002E342A5A|nr:methyltransferase [Nonomuraea sp. LP-02]MED7929213.1 methyltransferase [Nonomuraea sp. LP-02]